jgi:uncharacterized protein YjiS (DUF1127 family)
MIPASLSADRPRQRSALAGPASRPARRGAVWIRVRARLALWLRRLRERRELLEMSEIQRRDIGITRADVCREVSKPFWYG